LEHPFLQHHQQINTDISAFVSSVLDAGSASSMDTSDSANGL
jgi:hypothetical protein